METKNLQNVKKGFTIVELLTVMSIIVIIMALLVPALTMAKRYSLKVKQKSQFKQIDAGLQLYESDFKMLPPSEWFDGQGVTAAKKYCGAMKLAEAMVGRDMLGVHQDSTFNYNGSGLYPKSPSEINRQSRKGPYPQLESVQAYKLRHIYGQPRADLAGFTDPCTIVLTDVYVKFSPKTDGTIDPNEVNFKTRSGMPVLYYKASSSGTRAVVDLTITKEGTVPADGAVGLTSAGRIYDHLDNDDLVKMGIPDTSTAHPMASAAGYDGVLGTWGTAATTCSPYYFYNQIWNKSVTSSQVPYNKDSYILVSAGFDGLYGTKDDVFNFEP